MLRRDGPRLRQSGDGVLGHRRRNRECEGAQTFVAAAEPGSTVSAPPRADRAQERPRETKRLFGHRKIPQAEEHGPDLRGGHGAPTWAQEIPNVVAVVISRFSTVRTNRRGGARLPLSVCAFSASPPVRWALGALQTRSSLEIFGSYATGTFRMFLCVPASDCAQAPFLLTFLSRTVERVCSANSGVIVINVSYGDTKCLTRIYRQSKWQGITTPNVSCNIYLLIY